MMGVPISRILPLANSYLECRDEHPQTLVAQYGHLPVQAAAFAAAEEYVPTQELLGDFTRQLIIETSEGLPCTGLAELWHEVDPILRETVDPGIVLTQSDIEAAVALETLAGGAEAAEVRRLVLDHWDELNDPDEVLSRVFLTRLDVWSPAVADAWEALSAEGRRDAVAVSHQMVSPGPEDLAKIIGDTGTLEWVGASVFRTTLADLEPYDDLTEMARMGYFGGASYMEYVESFRQVLAGMGQVMYMQQSLDALSDLTDMTQQNFYESLTP